MLLSLGGAAQPFLTNRTDLGDPIRWNVTDLPLSFVIHEQGSDDIADDGDRLAIRQGFRAWEDVDGTAIAFLEDTDPASQARDDWESDDIHLVLFDEDDSSGLFPPGSGVVGTTVFEFDTATGDLLDGDILFNGSEQTFSSAIQGGAVDLRGAATHEVGHLLGLAHSAVAGATMAPFLAMGDFTRRTLDLDDQAGVVTLYPASVRGRLLGRVVLNGLPVAGAHVWASGGNGIVGGSTISEADGTFEIDGLLPNDYRVIAAPFDLPFTPETLGVVGYGDFNTFFRQSSVVLFSIFGAETLHVGDLPVGNDSALEPTGPFTVQTLERGSTRHFDLTVNGIVGGTPQVVIPSSGSLVVDEVTFTNGDQLGFDVTAPIGTPQGTYDIQISTNIGTTTTLPGMLEVISKAPALTGIVSFPVTIDCGGTQSGFEVVLEGTNLPTDPDDVEFIFGDEQAEVTVTSPGGVFVGAFPPPNDAGTVDLVVINPEGQEARLEAAFDYVDGGVLSIDSIFPPAADRSGGTLLTIRGAGFGEASFVALGATTTSTGDVTVVDPETITFIQPQLPPGALDVGVAQLGCNLLVAFQPGLFEAVDAPDPVLTAVVPDVITQGGSELIAITGSDFVDGAVVEMFADPKDGTGGTPLLTTFVSPNQLMAVTPPGPLPGGPADFLVRNPPAGVTGLQQVAVLEDGAEVDAPEIFTVSPGVIGRSGGVEVTVTGYGFIPGAVVELGADLVDYTGGTPLATTFVDDGTLTALVPTSLAPIDAGSVNVSVSMPGPIFAGQADAITFVDPTLTGISPPTLPPLGDVTLTVTGSGFAAPAVVRILVDPNDFTGGTALTTSVLDPTVAIAEVPAGALPSGTFSVAIDLPGGLTPGLVAVGEVPAPQLAAVTPGSLYETGGDVTLTVTGIGFLDGAEVQLFADLGDFSGGVPLPTTWISPTELEALVPTALSPLPTGLADVAVVMPGPQTAGLEGPLRIDPAALAEVSPATASISGVGTLDLTGVGFTAGASARLLASPDDLTGGLPMATTYVSPTQLTAVLPAGPLPEGQATVAVDLPGGVVVGVVAALELVAPTLGSVSPEVVGNGGGDVITVVGSHFVEGAVVELFTDPVTLTGGTALATTFIDANTLMAVTPEGPLPLAPASVAVRLPNDVAVALADAIEITALVNNGDKAGGSLDDQDTVDQIAFDGIAGTQVTIIHRRKGKSDLVPKLVLLDPDDLPIASTAETDDVFDGDVVKTSDKLAMLRKLTLPETGRYTIEVTRESGQGEYTFIFREKLPLAARRLKLTNKDAVVLGPDTSEFTFDLKAGTVISGTLRGKKKEGLQLVLEGLEDPSSVVLLSTDASGGVQADPELVELVMLGKELVSIRLKKFPVTAFGTYRLVLGAAPGTSGTVTGALTFRAPSKKKSFEDV